DPNLPRLSFTADTITCNRINAVVTVNTTGQSISNTSWTRGSILSSNSITTDVSGKLIATVTHADGCIITDSLVVQIDTVKIKPNLQLSEPDLTCNIRTINTTVQNGDIYNSSFIFKKDEINVSNISSITDSGSYKIIAQLTRNGCIDSTSVIVRDLQEVPSVTLESFCDNNNV
ncbi:MAG TPA: hypothetical protein PKD85_18110, partial [Saprospiraceae bacterium]|nr:hypothetical protein [Saprospiraceae bacterium]